MSGKFRILYKIVAGCVLIYSSFYVKEIIPHSTDDAQIDAINANLKSNMDDFCGLPPSLDSLFYGQDLELPSLELTHLHNLENTDYLLFPPHFLFVKMN